MVDLTKRRLDLLNKARDDLGKKHPHAHAFADQECRLALKIRLRDEKIFFNTDEELEEALSRVPGGLPGRDAREGRDGIDEMHGYDSASERVSVEGVGEEEGGG